MGALTFTGINANQSWELLWIATTNGEKVAGARKEFSIGRAFQMENPLTGGLTVDHWTFKCVDGLGSSDSSSSIRLTFDAVRAVSPTGSF